jgi:UDP-N-acetylglucosamine 2-epimerase
LAKAIKSDIIDHFKLTRGGYFLLTMQRPYSVDNPVFLSNLIHELGSTPEKIVFPVHPRTKRIINDNNILIPSNFLLVKPVSYLDFIWLQKNAKKIITDSGGIQKEAHLLKKPCVTLRLETEWIETVESGWNLLLNPMTEKNIAEKVYSFTPSKEHYPLFGENVAAKMVDEIKRII